MFQSARLIAVLILGASLGIRIGAAVLWHQSAVADGNAFRLGDSDSYWTLAEQLSQGKPYQYFSENARIFRAPLLPIALVPFVGFEDKNTAVLLARLVFCVLGTVAVGLVMLLGSRFGGTCGGLAAGALACLHPGAIGMSISVLSEALFIPLMLAHLLFLDRAIVKGGITRETGLDTIKSAALGGVFAGLAVLTRPSWLLFIPFTLALGCLLSRQKKKHIVIGIVSLLAFSATMSPWWIRNAQITGRFVPTTLQVGLSLYDGLHAGATGASDEGMAFSMRIQGEQRRIDSTNSENRESAALESTFEYRVDKRAKRLATEWALDHPFEVCRLAVAKFMRTWSLWPDGGDAGSTPIRFVVTLGSFGILALAIFGTAVLLVRPSLALGEQIALCWLPCIYFTLLHMVFVGSIRYREPAIFVLCSLAGVAVASIAGCYSAKNGGDASTPNSIPTTHEIQCQQGSATDRQEASTDPQTD